MQWQVQSIHFDADHKLIHFIESRLGKLNQFHDRIIAGEVFLRLDKSDVNENKIAEIKLSLPGRDLFARKQCKTFEEATDTAVEALRRQIHKHKTRIGQAS
ncbi:MAG: ribosome hibernation-promoting factor, HPF/YfiA family [Flavobacteriales bacterium]|jgi:putative sigma-54 modulation protein